MRPAPAHAVVAIPAKDEADRIPGCLAALAAQVDVAPVHVVLFLNNCNDDSVAVAEACAADRRLVLHIERRELPPGVASAGLARHFAMRIADTLVTPDGVLLTTDADSVAPPDWIAANLRAMRYADAVAGRAVIDPMEAALIPARLHEDDARECAYAALLDEIASLLDPDVADPWPRHDEHSGASIAVRAGVFRAAGGIPPIRSGEDRGFFRALRRIDARVRHAPEVWVTVSGRIDGRATGGMAETIRRRLASPDVWLDDRLETVAAATRRARLRRWARLVHAGLDRRHDALARALFLPGLFARARLEAAPFGAAWEAIEEASPALRRRRVRVASLPRQTRLADALLGTLRRGGGDPVDIAADAPRDRRASPVLSPA